LDIARLRQTNPDHWMKAAAIRALALDAVAAANSGHSGMPMGMADIATVLFEKHLNFDPADPRWPNRDRFILSNGHGSMLIYALLHLTGYGDVTMDQIRNFRQWGAITAGHPEYGHVAGVETTTGPLGQGIANAVGFAIAEEILRATWGKRFIDHHTYVFVGDGCLMEGISHEAIALAGKQELSRLIVMWDHNGITIDGKVSMADVTDQKARFAACGWDVFECDGHDPADIDRAITAAKASARPAMIACTTHIALGSAAQDTAKGHGALTDAKVVADTKAAYGWTAAPFEIPADVARAWRAIGARGAATRAAWEAGLAKAPPARVRAFHAAFAGEVPSKFARAVRAVKAKAAAGGAKVATRRASEIALEALNPVLGNTVGGSADLTGSNNTKTADLGIFGPENRKGRYIHYGIREHGMAAAMNGIALHGGLRPYGGTFFTFTDYARPAMRLSALMGVPVTYVMTHDSIGVGEDGPTHQPVEHLAICRATPNTHVIRPADTIEAAEGWEIALTAMRTPTVMVLSRQNLPTVRGAMAGAKNLVAQGAYVLADAAGKRQAIILASGSEVEVALKARDLLQAEGIGARVVSVPSMDLFAAQPESYRKKVLPAGPVRVAVEAGVRQPWDWLLTGERGRDGRAGFVGMTGFGASAPAERLYKEFGITAEAVAARVKALI
jgi:transketolase